MHIYMFLRKVRVIVDTQANKGNMLTRSGINIIWE